MRPPGNVHIHDSTVTLFEEPEEMPISGEYEDGFRREVLAGVVEVLRYRGWHVGQDPDIHKHYRCLDKNHRYCTHPSRLEAKLETSGRTLHLCFFQSFANITHRSGGFYEFDKLPRMPYLLRLRTVATLSFVAEWLCREFGYGGPGITRKALLLGPEALTNREIISERMKGAHWSRDDDKIDSYNRGTKDGALHVGERVFFTDSKGRWMTGTVEYHINNMWWVLWGDKGLRNMASFELQHSPPDNPRRKDNREAGQKRINQIMRTAADHNEFVRAEQLRCVMEAR